MFEYELNKILLNDSLEENSLPVVNYSISGIDRVTNISYKCFFENYLLMNKPCLISYPAVKTWRSTQDWVTPNGKPNFDYLENEFGSCVVPVADCDQREYNSQLKKNMPLGEYINYWKKLNQTDTEKSPCLYLKDWHFFREFPNYEAYETPEYCHSDWLNEFCEKESDDYKFVYMGPKGSWTPFHADVFGSFSWSVNICGCKRWLLFPPGEEKILRNENKQLLYELKDCDLEKVSYIEVIQEPGEVIFVPSGWYHQVWNLKDTISINHNWFNGCNITYIWHCITSASLDVEKEMSDLKGSKDWEEQCQVILRVHHGLNYADFLEILKFIFQSRSNQLSLNKPSKINAWKLLFDLFAVKKVCFKMLESKLPENLKENVVSFIDNVSRFIGELKIKLL